MTFYQVGDSVVFKIHDLATLHSYKEGAPAKLLSYEQLDLANVSRIRFDPVSACNAQCVFCDADFPNIPARHVPLEDVNLFVNAQNLSTKYLSVGCSYEPLMGKYFEEYPRIFKKVHRDWKVLIATNGIMLDRRDIAPWVEIGFDHLHVSIHSNKANVYDRVLQTRNMFQRVERNMKATRDRFPRIEIRVTNVVLKTNCADLLGFCHWAFDEIGADKVELYRAEFHDTPIVQKHVEYHQTNFGEHPKLSDEEWGLAIRDCVAYYGSGIEGRYVESGVNLVILEKKSRPS